MTRGAAAPPPRLRQSRYLLFIINWAKGKFFGQKPAAKNEKKIFVLYLLKKKNGIHSV